VTTRQWSPRSDESTVTPGSRRFAPRPLEPSRQRALSDDDGRRLQNVPIGPRRTARIACSSGRRRAPVRHVLPARVSGAGVRSASTLASRPAWITPRPWLHVRRGSRLDPGFASSVDHASTQTSRQAWISPRPRLRVQHGSRLDPCLAPSMDRASTRASRPAWIAPRPRLHVEHGSRLDPSFASSMDRASTVPPEVSTRTREYRRWRIAARRRRSAGRRGWRRVALGEHPVRATEPGPVPRTAGTTCRRFRPGR